jgi:acyl-CoA synthetase (AMP-forming)/AMP-acid ligase II
LSVIEQVLSNTWLAEPAVFAADASGVGEDAVLADTPGDLAQVLFARAAATPDRIAYLFLQNGEGAETQLTYAMLARQVRDVALRLVAAGLAGQRILLLHPQGPDFARDFFAVLAAGAVAVPSPHMQGRRAAAARIAAIVADAKPAIVLTTRDLVGSLRGSVPDNLYVTATEDLPPAVPSAALPVIDPEALALLQYTSGSTGAPRGVMITHRAMMANQAMIRQLFNHSPDSVMVSWLPMFHDMGLIGSLLQPVYAGFPAVMMTPEAFLEEPVRWLRAISQYGGTTAGAPNFAYDYCVKRIRAEDRADLDLRSWQVAFNGSEPVRAATLDRFAQAFAPYGFRARASYPCYGMAEATLLVAGGTPGRMPERFDRGTPPQPAVSCGQTGPGHDLAIVAPGLTQALPDGQVGEIWFRGPSIATGYWNHPALNADSFGQTLTDGSSGWMRTGDLGLIQDGALYVTGRLKDVIIVKGRNHYPQDIEETAAAAHPALRPDAGAAFLVERGEKQSLVLVTEIAASYFRDPPVTEMAAALRSAISEHHGLHLAVLALIKPGSLPKTTSGKVQRGQAMTAYLDGALAVLTEDRHGPDLRNIEHSSQANSKAI